MKRKKDKEAKLSANGGDDIIIVSRAEMWIWPAMHWTSRTSGIEPKTEGQEKRKRRAGREFFSVELAKLEERTGKMRRERKEKEKENEHVLRRFARILVTAESSGYKFHICIFPAYPDIQGLLPVEWLRCLVLLDY